jgi:two-component system response regulator DegU
VSVDVRAVLSLGLTERELEIIDLVANGMNNKEIGDRLFISDKTVKNHKTTLYRKLNARNAIEVIRAAVRAGLVTYPDSA